MGAGRDLPWFDAAAIRAALRPRQAVDALAVAIHAGLDPAAGIPRSVVPMTHGELLVMAAEYDAVAGVKLATVAPGNAGRGLPRIQGVFVLFDAETLAPVALLDGIELTALRTPAVSLLAARDRLLASGDPLDIVVFGTGIQAVRHVEGAVDVVEGHRPVRSVTYLCRRPGQTSVPDAAGLRPRVLTADPDDVTGAAREAITGAGLLVCATTARRPLFDGRWVGDDAVVVAVGSHQPDAREVDDQLAARSCVVVEDVTTARREAGDIVLAIESGALDPDRLVSLTSAVRNPGLMPHGCPLLFKSTGMAWQDVVVARAVSRAVVRS